LLWPLPETVLLSACGRSLDLVPPHLNAGARILLLTSGHDAPAKLARPLVRIGFDLRRINGT